jgi:hypothetical protein
VRFGAEPGVDEQRSVAPLHQQPPDAGDQEAVVVEMIVIDRPVLIGGGGQPTARFESGRPVRDVGDRQIADAKGTNAWRPGQAYAVEFGRRGHVVLLVLGGVPPGGGTQKKLQLVKFELQLSEL